VALKVPTAPPVSPHLPLQALAAPLCSLGRNEKSACVATSKGNDDAFFTTDGASSAGAGAFFTRGFLEKRQR